MWHKGSFIVVVGMFLTACGPSAARRSEIQSGVSNFVLEWNQNDLNRIYKEADPHFRQLMPLDAWLSWAAYMRNRHGLLNNVEIVRMHRNAPNVEIYGVETVMKYGNGDTKGGFTFLVDQKDKLRLMGVILEEF
jgi:hypothetical protein